MRRSRHFTLGGSEHRDLDTYSGVDLRCTLSATATREGASSWTRGGERGPGCLRVLVVAVIAGPGGWARDRLRRVRFGLVVSCLPVPRTPITCSTTQIRELSASATRSWICLTRAR